MPNHTDLYFTRDLAVLLKEGFGNMRVRYRVFFRQEGIMCGLHDVLKLFKNREVNVFSLQDGEYFSANETVMVLEGTVTHLFDLETEILGHLTISGAASRMAECVAAANGKPVLDMAARHLPPELHSKMGYAGWIGGAYGTSVQAAVDGAKERGAYQYELGGTVPHATTAVMGGSTLDAAAAFAKIYPDEVIALPDFEGKEQDVIRKLAAIYGSRLKVIRLDTHGGRVHQGGTDDSYESIDADWYQDWNNVYGRQGQFPQWMWGKGVTVELAYNARRWLDENGATECKIVASSGFTPEKIEEFESANAPVDMYGTGSWFQLWHPTADIFERQISRDWVPAGKAGRNFTVNTRLKRCSINS